MKPLICIIAFLFSVTSFAQKPGNYMVVQYDTTGKQKFGYVFTNPGGDTITRLDTSKYYICFTDTFQYFAVVGLNARKGWWAIDKNEKILFQVYNTSNGEPSPDALRDGMIRIVGDSGKIGFADYKGTIVIKPQFEAASSFYNSKAIIGMQCKEVLWCCRSVGADKHYATKCNQIGYINREGDVLMSEHDTFEQVQKEIGWKSEDEEE
ncbi:WG repeat-containing protein [Chitinophagaceae bacterium MMS25-I14]